MYIELSTPNQESQFGSRSSSWGEEGFMSSQQNPISDDEDDASFADDAGPAESPIVSVDTMPGNMRVQRQRRQQVNPCLSPGILKNSHSFYKTTNKRKVPSLASLEQPLYHGMMMSNTTTTTSTDGTMNPRRILDLAETLAQVSMITGHDLTAEEGDNSTAMMTDDTEGDDDNEELGKDSRHMIRKRIRSVNTEWNDGSNHNLTNLVSPGSVSAALDARADDFWSEEEDSFEFTIALNDEP